jgi:uncharacterized membrane protein YphA (DoxX/SURF4 family)
MRWRKVRPWVGTIGRLVLGGVWLAAGLSKLGDLAGSGRAVVAYRLLPAGVADVLGSVLPFVEIAIGVLLLLGLATRVAAAASGVLLVAYIAGVASVWARGLRIDCGCFGGGGDLTSDTRPQYATEIVRDIALLIVAGFLVVRPWTRVSLDSWVLGTGEAPRAKGTHA